MASIEQAKVVTAGSPPRSHPHEPMIKINRLLPSLRGAEFSPCRVWRYSLWRSWSDEPLCAFVGLNPSTADEDCDDPTIRRCIRFAKDWGYGGLVMLNAYGFRATLPKDMQAAPEPIGAANNAALYHWSLQCDRVVAAWGVNIDDRRQKDVLALLSRNCEVMCLGVTKHGYPRHPLYVAAAVQPVTFESRK